MISGTQHWTPPAERAPTAGLLDMGLEGGLKMAVLPCSVDNPSRWHPFSPAKVYTREEIHREFTVNLPSAAKAAHHKMPFALK